MNHVVKTIYHGHWHYYYFDFRSIFTLKHMSCDWLAWLTCVCWRAIKTKHSRASHRAFYHGTSLRMRRFFITYFTKVSVVYSIVCALLAFKWLSVWIMMASTVKFTSDESLGGKWKFLSLNASSCQSNVAAISHVAVDA